MAARNSRTGRLTIYSISLSLSLSTGGRPTTRRTATPDVCRPASDRPVRGSTGVPACSSAARRLVPDRDCRLTVDPTVTGRKEDLRPGRYLDEGAVIAERTAEGLAVLAGGRVVDAHVAVLARRQDVLLTLVGLHVVERRLADDVVAASELHLAAVGLRRIDPTNQ